MAGTASLIASIVFAFQAPGGWVTGFLFLIGSGVGVPVAIKLGFKLLPRTSLGKSFILTGPTDAKEQTVETGLKDMEGKEGVAKTMLRPSGVAIIEGERIDVQTEGEIVEKDSRIQVVKVVGNTVFVKSV